MRDSARVFASVNSGLTWELLATNNNTGLYAEYELPHHISTSSRLGTLETQIGQELFDNTGSWRQARIDLGEYAGQSNIQLRFDFATAGQIEVTNTTVDIGNATPSAIRVVNAAGDLTTTTVVPLDSVTGLEVGMIVRETVAGTNVAYGTVSPVDSVSDVLDTTIAAIDSEQNTITLASPLVSLANGTELSFFKELAPKNAILGVAANAGETGGNNTARGLNNGFEGLYIDDIVIGFAERGEMVTAASSNLTGFYDIQTPTSIYFPDQILEGEYQLEIRRGTEYGSTPLQTTTGDFFRDRIINIDRTYDTNDRFVSPRAAPNLVLARNDLREVDGVTLSAHGNGVVSANGSFLLLDDAAARGSTTNSMAAWNVELSGQPKAFLNYTVSLGESKVVRTLPDAFIYNSWDETVPADEVVGLPEGDGVAVSTDGGTTWKTVDSFGWTGSRVVDLTRIAGPLNDDTVIGFFRSGVVTAGDATVMLTGFAVTASPPATSTGTIGDANNTHEFEQGQFIVANNIITSAASYGVRIDAGRDTGSDPDNNYTGTTNAPHLGVPRNTPVLNNAGLVPGVVVANNVISGSGDTGVVYAGASSADQAPESGVPFGRILNNTIVGAAGGQVTLRVSAPALPISDQIHGEIRRAQLDDKFSEIHSITIYDSGSYDGGAKGVLSGLDVDAIMLSQGSAGTYQEVLGLSKLDVFDFTPAGVELSLGTMRPGGTLPGIQGEELFGTVGGVLDNSIATLGVIDATFSNAGDPETGGFVSLGDNGSITFTFSQPITVGGPLYLYVTENSGPETVGAYIEVAGTPLGATTGIAVTSGASPTILNNVFAELGTGVLVGAGGPQQPVISSSAFYHVGAEVAGATQTQGMTLANDPFVNAKAGNFYPSASTAIVDSSINSLQDRNSFAVFKEPLGIAPSPIVAPSRDVFGQSRADDPGQASAPGLGLDVFKDRGAVERIDRNSPTARLVSPLDQSSSAPLDDKDDGVDSVRLEGRSARGIRQFVIQLDDAGVGIDRDSFEAGPVSASQAVTLLRNGTPLTLGADYFYQFNANTNQIVISSTVVYELGDYLVEMRGSADSGVLLDNAGNPLRANASDGSSSYASFSISLADVPSLPLGASGVAGDGTVELSWLPSSTSQNDPVTEYQIEYSDDTGLNWLAAASVNGGQITASPVTVAHPNNLPRTYRIRGVSGLGAGEYSSPFAAVPAETRDVVASLSGEEAVEVSWTSPVHDGGNTIKQFYVDASVDDGASWNRVQTAAGDVRTTVVTGLSKGVPVQLRVAAGTVASLGAWSSASTPVTPEGRPDAPSDLVVVFDDSTGAVNLTWTVPYDGEQPITDYVVSIDGVSQSGEVIEEVDETTRRTSFTGLGRGQTYLFKVAAANTYGTGDASDEVSLELPTSASLAPQSLIAVPGNQQVSLSWDAPADTGGLPIDGYVAQYAGTEAGPWQDVTDPDSTDQTAVVTGLVRNTPYWFRVAATNAEGTGGYVTAGPVAPTGTPEVPSGSVSVAANEQADGTVDLSWTYNPEPAGEQQVTGYDVYQRQVGEAWPVTPIQEDIVATTTSVTDGLSIGTAYEFRIVAKNILGEGAEGLSAAVTPRVPADAPTNLIPTVGDGSVSLAWAAPANDGGTAVTDYLVQYSSDAGAVWQDYDDGASAELTAVVENLTNGTLYRFRVAAQTADGTLLGAWSAATNDVESVGLPAAPTDVTVAAVASGEGGTIDLVWTAPSESGGRPIEGYSVQYAEYSGDSESDWQEYAGNLVVGTEARVTGLVNGQAYVFRVAAVTAHGTGAFSVVTPVVTPRGDLRGPVNLQSGSTQTTVTLAWDEPEGGYGSGTSVNYEVEIRLGDQTATRLSNGARWITFSELEPSTTYDFRVRAVLPGGLRGDWSLVHSAATTS
jgi:hypothetical protein